MAIVDRQNFIPGITTWSSTFAAEADFVITGTDSEGNAINEAVSGGYQANTSVVEHPADSGSFWLCITTGTEETPSRTASDWVEFGGSGGDPITRITDGSAPANRTDTTTDSLVIVSGGTTELDQFRRGLWVAAVGEAAYTQVSLEFQGIDELVRLGSNNVTISADDTFPLPAQAGDMHFDTSSGQLLIATAGGETTQPTFRIITGSSSGGGTISLYDPTVEYNDGDYAIVPHTVLEASDLPVSTRIWRKIGSSPAGTRPYPGPAWLSPEPIRIDTDARNTVIRSLVAARGQEYLDVRPLPSDPTRIRGILYGYTGLEWVGLSGTTLDPDDGLVFSDDRELSINHQRVVTLHNTLRTYTANDMVSVAGPISGSSVPTLQVWRARIDTPSGESSAVPGVGTAGNAQWERLQSDIGSDLQTFDDDINVHNGNIQISGNDVEIRPGSSFEDGVLLNNLVQDVAESSGVVTVTDVAGNTSTFNVPEQLSDLNDFADIYGSRTPIPVQPLPTGRGFTLPEGTPGVGTFIAEFNRTSGNFSIRFPEATAPRWVDGTIVDINGVRTRINGVPAAPSDGVQQFQLVPFGTETVASLVTALSGVTPTVSSQSLSFIEQTTTNLVLVEIGPSNPHLRYNDADLEVQSIDLAGEGLTTQLDGTIDIAANAIGLAELNTVSAGSPSTVLGQTSQGIDWVPASGGGSALEVRDETITLSSTVTRIDFTGDGVTATADGSNITVDVPSSSGSFTTREVQTINAAGTASNTITQPEGNLVITLNDDYTFTAATGILFETVERTPGQTIRSTGSRANTASTTLIDIGTPDLAAAFAADDIISDTQEGTRTWQVLNVSGNFLIVSAIGTSPADLFPALSVIYRRPSVSTPADVLTLAFTGTGITPTRPISPTLLADNLVEGDNSQRTLEVIRTEILAAYPTFTGVSIIISGSNRLLIINTNQANSLSISAATLTGSTLFTAVSTVAGGVVLGSTYTILRPDGTQLSFTASASAEPIATVLNNIAAAINSDVTIRTSTTVSGNTLVITEMGSGPRSGVWSIVANHGSGDSDIVFGTAVEVSDGGREIVGVGTGFSVSNGVLSAAQRQIWQGQNTTAITSSVVLEAGSPVPIPGGSNVALSATPVIPGGFNGDLVTGGVYRISASYSAEAVGTGPDGNGGRTSLTLQVSDSSGTVLIPATAGSYVRRLEADRSHGAFYTIERVVTSTADGAIDLDLLGYSTFTPTSITVAVGSVNVIIERIA